jgi:hypothetical protein
MSFSLVKKKGCFFLKQAILLLQLINYSISFSTEFNLLSIFILQSQRVKIRFYIIPNGLKSVATK